MGRIVEFGEAVDPGSDWARNTAPARAALSGAVFAASLMMMAYGLGGLVYGVLPVFVGNGFIVLNGIPVVLAAAGSLGLAAGWASHLVQRHWSPVQSQDCERVRLRAYQLTACGWVGGFIAALGIELGAKDLAQPVALEALAQWPFMPLPLVWQHFLGLASDAVVIRLLIAGIFTFALGIVMAQFWRAATLVLFGATACIMAAYLIGDASYQFAAARSLSGMQSPAIAGEFQQYPGVSNIWTFLCWWGGWSTLLVAAVLVWAGLFVREEQSTPTS